MPIPGLQITKSEFRSQGLKVLGILGFVAAWTPTGKDDAFVALLSSIFKDDVQFDKFCELLGVTDSGVIAPPPVV